MSKRSGTRNRVMSDRLWDDHGREWHKQVGWLSHEEVGRLVTTTRVAVHAYGLPVTWLSPSEAQQWWKQNRAHTQDGQQAADLEDSDGRTCAAARWTSAGAAILVFEAFC